jgi:hypothetical protein
MVKSANAEAKKVEASKIGLEGVHLTFEQAGSPRLWREIDVESATKLIEQMDIFCSMDLGMVVTHRGVHAAQGWMIVMMTAEGRCAVVHGHLLPNPAND